MVTSAGYFTVDTILYWDAEIFFRPTFSSMPIFMFKSRVLAWREFLKIWTPRLEQHILQHPSYADFQRMSFPHQIMMHSRWRKRTSQMFTHLDVFTTKWALINTLAPSLSKGSFIDLLRYRTFCGKAWRSCHVARQSRGAPPSAGRASFEWLGLEVDSELLGPGCIWATRNERRRGNDDGCSRKRGSEFESWFGWSSLANFAFYS